MYKSIEKYVNVVNRSVQRKEKKVTLSIEDAILIQSELTKLLLELRENNKPKQIELDGGQFNA